MYIYECIDYVQKKRSNATDKSNVVNQREIKKK